MNDQFIHGVIFDWDRIDNDSYLKKIEAFKGVEKQVYQMQTSIVLIMGGFIYVNMKKQRVIK